MAVEVASSFTGFQERNELAVLHEGFAIYTFMTPQVWPPKKGHVELET